jgi:hypothetical protein
MEQKMASENERRGWRKDRTLLIWLFALILGALGTLQFHSALFHSSNPILYPGNYKKILAGLNW